ncbi:MAG: hypothetical protein Q8L54_15275 [Devosia sp.]|nr:hypothetical protein [Devosia sp.]
MTQHTHVPFKTDEARSSGALIKIFRRRRRIAATVIRCQWLEPDGRTAVREMTFIGRGFKLLE